ncbi:MAG: RlmE family RNA methyltransferase [Pseudomonadota bacterium]|nr:RlmE family RNA methyltransferase [Pseudomonadota bacterium]
MEVIIVSSNKGNLLKGRNFKVKLKTAKGRKISSTRWLERQLNDPFVIQAKKDGYRSRSAFKLIQLNQRFDFLKPGNRVLDLGAFPGGWCQVAAKATNSDGKIANLPIGFVLGIDLKALNQIEGVRFECLDFLEIDAESKIKEWTEGSVDVVLSDMAPSATGHKKTDHLRIVNLCEQAASLSFDILNCGGTFVSKVLEGGTDSELQKILKKNFFKVVNSKPSASRADSSEKFVVAKGFRG